MHRRSQLLLAAALALLFAHAAAAKDMPKKEKLLRPLIIAHRCTGMHAPLLKSQPLWASSWYYL